MSDAQIVSGTRRAIKEMSDGTIRVQVDIDPRYRAAFWALFPSIDMPVALAPLVGDFEKREPKPDDHGQHYAVLYKSGWFHNPRVVAAFGVDKGLNPDQRIEAIKQSIYEALSVESLTEISPDAFSEYCDIVGVRATLPAAFGVA